MQLSLVVPQTLHWSTLIANKDGDVDMTSLLAQQSSNEMKRREAVWELFQAECVFLIDHLMVLKHVRNISCRYAYHMALHDVVYVT